LVKNGVPWDVAMSMPDEERFAYCVTFSGFEGNVFNWETLRYEKPAGR
jgi:hypothetical protein